MSRMISGQLDYCFQGGAVLSHAPVGKDYSVSRLLRTKVWPPEHMQDMLETTQLSLNEDKGLLVQLRMKM